VTPFFVNRQKMKTLALFCDTIQSWHQLVSDTRCHNS